MYDAIQTDVLYKESYYNKHEEQRGTCNTVLVHPVCFAFTFTSFVSKSMPITISQSRTSL